MGLPVTYVFTHDSVWLGEDGPTHQPIEHAMALRAMPGLDVLRPADATETADAWRAALEHRDGPTALLLTRQDLQPLGSIADGADGRRDTARGGWVVGQWAGEAADDPSATPDAIVLATGSEVAVACEAARMASATGASVRVVAMPSWSRFAAQPQSWRDGVLPAAVRARVSVEAGATLGWCRWIGDGGEAIGIDRFGLSAPGAVAADALGISAAAVADAVQRAITAAGGNS